MDCGKAKPLDASWLAAALSWVGATSVWVLVQVGAMALLLVALGMAGGLWFWLARAHPLLTRAGALGLQFVVVLVGFLWLRLLIRYRFRLPHLAAMMGLARGHPEARRNPIRYGRWRVREAVPALRDFFHFDGWLRDQLQTGADVDVIRQRGARLRRWLRKTVPGAPGFWSYAAWALVLDAPGRATPDRLSAAVARVREARTRSASIARWPLWMGLGTMGLGALPILGLGWVLEMPSWMIGLLAIGGGIWITGLVVGPLRLALAVVVAHSVAPATGAAQPH